MMAPAPTSGSISLVNGRISKYDPVNVSEVEITEGFNGHINGIVNGFQRPSAFAEGARVVPKSLSESMAATKAEYRKASQLLFAAYTKGITTWDTANAYSNGVSEEIIGRTIKRYNIPRRKLVLMTKVGRIVAHPDDSDPGDFVAFLDDLVGRSKDYTNQYGLSRTAIFNAVEQSLERLQTSYIDVLHIHRYDDTVPPEETMQALHQLVMSGKVRYLAASSMWTYQFATLQSIAERNSWTKMVAMQNHYNLLYREEEREMIKYCRKTGVGILPWSPLAEGLLARPPGLIGTSTRSLEPSRFGNGQSEPDKSIIKRTLEVSKARNWTMSQVALAWLNRRVAAPIIGMNSVGRMDEALAVRGMELSWEEEAYLEEAYEPKRIQGHS
ncbi:hypothetical protein DL769_002610 [Monosporascus sp. CRB-8-3]|nr:hypothetical protein DL769_002610 [Monosporascus sp. CRB-8-3]